MLIDDLTNDKEIMWSYSFFYAMAFFAPVYLLVLFFQVILKDGLSSLDFSRNHIFEPCFFCEVKYIYMDTCSHTYIYVNSKRQNQNMGYCASMWDRGIRDINDVHCHIKWDTCVHNTYGGHAGSQAIKSTFAILLRCNIRKSAVSTNRELKY